MVDGVSYGFWNRDHLEVFGFADTSNEAGFAPLYDGDNGALAAGVRYWGAAEGQTKRYTLYEPDGATEYIQRKGEDLQVLQEKRPYLRDVRRDGLALRPSRAAGTMLPCPLSPCTPMTCTSLSL